MLWFGVREKERESHIVHVIYSGEREREREREREEKVIVHEERIVLLAQLIITIEVAFLIACCPSVNKLFTSITIKPISTKLGTKHPWVNVIQDCSNEGPRPFPRGIIEKIH